MTSGTASRAALNNRAIMSCFVVILVPFREVKKIVELRAILCTSRFCRREPTLCHRSVAAREGREQISAPAAGHVAADTPTMLTVEPRQVALAPNLVHSQCAIVIRRLALVRVTQARMLDDFVLD